MRIKNGLIVVLLCTSAWSHVVAASTIFIETYTCPLTRTKFQAEVNGSGTSYCQRLDFKAIGAISAPWLVPECPDDGFVLYRKRFSRAELKVLRPWVQSEHYQKVLRQESTYFRVAETMKRLGKPDEEIGWAYLQASWQVERQPERYERYLEAARTAFLAGISTLRDSREKNAEYAVARLQTLTAEVSRRLGRMTEAEALLEAAHPVMPLLDESHRIWHAAISGHVAARFSGRAYFERPEPPDEPKGFCASLDEGP